MTTKAQIRKIVTVVEETLQEGGRTIDPPTRRAAAVAVIANPFAGQQDIATALGLARSTVARWLWRVGRLGRLDPPAPVRR